MSLLYLSHSPLQSLPYFPLKKSFLLKNYNFNKLKPIINKKSFSTKPILLNPNIIISHFSLSSNLSNEEQEFCSNILFIKGLSQATSEGSLKGAFSQFGEVDKVKIITDKKSKQSLGFAYIWFLSSESAQMAVKEINGKFFDGRFIMVTVARPGSCKTLVKTVPYKF